MREPLLLLLSGEGPSDIGASLIGGVCWGDQFQAGPMAQIIEKILDPILGFAPIESSRQTGGEKMLRFVPKNQIENLEERNPKAVRMGASGHGKGTKWHFKYAEILSRYAHRLEEQEKVCVLLVFFRDKDKEAQGTWQEKWDSMQNGFAIAKFERGVPMLPNPKSEAWLLCAFQKNYRNCAVLEDGPDTDGSPNSLKNQLSVCCGHLNSLQLAQRVAEELEVEKIEMPSFLAFKTRLEEVARGL